MQRPQRCHPAPLQPNAFGEKGQRAVCAHRAKPAAAARGARVVNQGGETFYAQVRPGEMPLISKLFQCIVANNTAIKCDTMFTRIILYVFNGNLISCKMIRIEMTCTKTVKHVGHNSAFL